MENSDVRRTRSDTDARADFRDAHAILAELHDLTRLPEPDFGPVVIDSTAPFSFIGGAIVIGEIPAITTLPEQK